MSEALKVTPVTELHGVGERLAEKLEKLGIASVEDLLFHFPYRYEDRTELSPIGAVSEGEQVIVEGEILHAQVIRGRRPMLVARLSDGTGSIDLRFFNFFGSQVNQLARGRRIQCYGEVRAGRQQYELIHPEYRIMTEGKTGLLEENLTPIYPVTDGLKQQSLRKLVNQALSKLKNLEVPELIPAALKKRYQLADIDWRAAIEFLHTPESKHDLSRLAEGQHPIQQRLAAEELLAHQLSMLRLKAANQAHKAPAMKGDQTLSEGLIKQLPFELTGAQQRVIKELGEDMRRSIPMMRLVQGDVGSGKTLVAAMAALQAIESGYQVALMAPTELLAEQHAENFNNWFRPLELETVWLSGKVTGKARTAAYEAINDGRAQMVVGTHALFQEAVEFHKLGLMIIDEQHRFGVEQRMALQKKTRSGDYPHQLIMTATPIPRTLAMSMYADMDTSVIDELPPGRTPIQTVALSNERRQDIIERIRSSCVDEQRQVYWVCTLIEESEKLMAQAAEAIHQQLVTQLPELKVGLVHGRLSSREKLDLMQRFKDAELDVLVATTVIEVGVDVPNASLMVIENAERLGLAQLHQLRGRVGRGSVDSHCVLLYQTPLSSHAKARIAAMRESTDGFFIAEKDLELRGPGEVLGTRQTGVASFRIADLYRDRVILPKVNELARQIQTEHPELIEPLIKRWLGIREQFAKV